MSLKPNRTPPRRFGLYSASTKQTREAHLNRPRPIRTGYGDLTVRQGCAIGLASIAVILVMLVVAIVVGSALLGLAVNVFRAVTGV